MIETSAAEVGESLVTIVKHDFPSQFWHVCVHIFLCVYPVCVDISCPFVELYAEGFGRWVLAAGPDLILLALGRMVQGSLGKLVAWLLDSKAQRDQCDHVVRPPL